MPQNKNRFDVILLEAIDEALQYNLGESGKIAVYYHFQNTCRLEKEKIPEKPEVFADFLYTLFGYGAKIIEEAILESLHKKLGIQYKKVKNSKFTDYLKKLAKNKEN